MGRAYSLSLESSSTTFKTQAEAKKHYKSIIKELYESKETISSGEIFEQLKEIYTLYCQYTNYHLEHLEKNSIVGFKADQKITEKSGVFSTTVCLYAIFSNETETDFSIDNAIQTITKKQNS